MVQVVNEIRLSGVCILVEVSFYIKYISAQSSFYMLFIAIASFLS